jgi:radical S-adenosyl methionine domain-containing protein 2
LESASFSLTGLEQMNFSRGEHFLQDSGEYMVKLLRFCKEELSLPSISIMVNASSIQET